MRQDPPRLRQLRELLIPLLIFLILVWYTYGILLVAPYPGFGFNTSTGRVEEIYSQPEQGPTLQIGDRLIQIGPVTWKDYKQDGRLVFFKDVQAGEIVNVTVNRKDVEMVIPWKFAGFDKAVFKTRLFNLWWLAFAFWFFGTLAEITIRPKDMRRSLFIIANYLTALWLVFGTLSSRHLWGSSMFLHAATWLLLPVYLHLHWVFPRPLKELPKSAWMTAYAAGFLFAAAEIAQLLPKSLYAFAFLAALIGSILLETAHFIRQKDQRREVMLLAVSILLAFAPSILFGISVIRGAASHFGPAALFATPFMPLIYFYVIFRSQLGGLEVRINRFISIYSFLILFGIGLVILAYPITSLDLEFDTAVFMGVIAIFAVTYMVLSVFPRFQTFVEKRFLGIKLPYQNFQETYSSRIITSISIASLVQLLEDEMFPSLLIRQYAFLQADHENLKARLVKNVSADALPLENGISDLLERSGKYIPNFSSAEEWIRLILPLRVGDSFIGFWLLGRRDPDDIYAQAEIPILQSIANQTAIAVSNILHAEQVRKLHLSDAERNEMEKARLARELHDSVLNELAILRNSLDESHLPPNFQTLYEGVVNRLREVASDLQSPMLIYGLAEAIKALGENLMERSGDKVRIKVDMGGDEKNPPHQVGLHLYRMTQEACQNAIRHSGAKNIFITGNVSELETNVTIEDNGLGFDAQVNMNELSVRNHFGLKNILERAQMIGAEIQIQSAVNTGTKIHVKWKQAAAID